MEYWIRSLPPLMSRKCYLNTVQEVMEWIDYVLRISNNRPPTHDKIYYPKGKPDIFRECFVFLKLDSYVSVQCRMPLFKSDPESIKWMESKKREVKDLEKVWKSEKKKQAKINVSKNDAIC